jgi:hypothetical protein
MAKPSILENLLTLVRIIKTGIHSKGIYLCKCGNQRICRIDNVKSGRQISCGCQNKSRTHGESRKAPEYHIWCGMIQRCHNPKSPAYHNYGGRGIAVSERWRGPDGYVNFISDVGRRPSAKHSFDRWPNNDGNYEPGNWRWATSKEQNRNTRKTRLTVNGITKTYAEWAEETGISRFTLRIRIARLGWDPLRAITEPPQKHDRIFEYNGRAATLPEWAELTGINVDALMHRVRIGWPIEQILTEPLRWGPGRKKSCASS